MSLRIRASGEIVCAAEHGPEEGDIYVDDALHYYLREVVRVIDTDNEGDTWYFVSNVKTTAKITALKLRALEAHAAVWRAINRPQGEAYASILDGGEIHEALRTYRR